MATKKVTQKEVMWVKAKNGKPGFLALRSDPTKAFSGVVVGIAGSSTKSVGGVARYVNGRNVLKRGSEGKRTSNAGMGDRSAVSGTVTSARRSASSGSSVTSGTVTSAKAMSRPKQSPRPGEYQPTGIGPKRKSAYTPSGQQSSRSSASGTVTSAKSGSKPQSKYVSSPTVAAAKKKGSQRYKGYKQTRWSM